MRAGHRAGHRRAGMRDHAGWAGALLVALATLTATATTLVPARAVAAPAAGAAQPSAEDPGLVGGPVQDPKAVLDYWTPERLASATPLDLPAVAAAGSQPGGRAGRAEV